MFESYHASAQAILEKYNTEDADIILVVYGLLHRMAIDCADSLRKENIKTGVFRPVSLWPFPYKELSTLASSGKRFLVVEMSAGQMVEDVRLAVCDDSRVSFYGVMELENFQHSKIGISLILFWMECRDILLSFGKLRMRKKIQ